MALTKEPRSSQRKKTPSAALTKPKTKKKSARSSLKVAKSSSSKASKKKATSKSKKKDTSRKGFENTQSTRGIWNGNISFGLINIPVRLVSSKEQPDLNFTMLDPRNLSPVGYKYYNKLSGKEISRSETVKAFEFKKGEFVILSDADFKKANPEATQTIDIQNFVELEEIDPVYFMRAYYILPNRGGDKAYSLLSQSLQASGKVAIAKIVLHTKQYLTALIPKGDYLLLELLHFAEDVKDIEELSEISRKTSHILPEEEDMAMRLIEGMSTQWVPSKYKDTYREDIMKRVQAKVRSGKATEITKDFPKVSRSEVKESDLLPLLQKSLASSRKKTTKKTLH